MFETTAVEARSQKRSTVAALMLPVSVAIHALAFSGALFFSVWNVEMPENAPKQLSALVFTPSVPVPDGGGGARPRSSRVAEPAQADVPRETVAPDRVQSARTEVGADPASTSTADVGEGDLFSSSSSIPGDGTGDGAGTGNGPGVGTGTGDSLGVPAGPLIPGGDVKSPLIVLRPEPRYPDALRAIRMKGFAVVECIIGTDGMPRAIELKNTNHPLFGASAVEAIGKWRFQPGTLNGRKVETILQLKVEFLLR